MKNKIVKPKTKKALTKRLKVTARGKVLRHVPGSGHLKSRKSSARLRKMRQEHALTTPFARQAKIMLGV